jgi:hypothetical protein
MPAGIRLQSRLSGSTGIHRAHSIVRQAAKVIVMTTVLIASLIAIALYLAKRWSDTSAENSQLRTQVASLKRQLSRRDR